MGLCSLPGRLVDSFEEEPEGRPQHGDEGGEDEEGGVVERGCEEDDVLEEEGGGDVGFAEASGNQGDEEEKAGEAGIALGLRGGPCR